MQKTGDCVDSGTTTILIMTGSRSQNACAPKYKVGIIYCYFSPLDRDHIWCHQKKALSLPHLVVGLRRGGFSVLYSRGDLCCHKVVLSHIFSFSAQAKGEFPPLSSLSRPFFSCVHVLTKRSKCARVEFLLLCTTRSDVLCAYQKTNAPGDKQRANVLERLERETY